jgi:hypothetical protein
LLLVEAIARTCKVLYRRNLRNHTRNGVLQAVAAFSRGKSKEEDYRELAEYQMNNRKYIALSFFNTVLGCGSQTNEFWKGEIIIFLNGFLLSMH